MGVQSAGVCSAWQYCRSASIGARRGCSLPPGLRPIFAFLVLGGPSACLCDTGLATKSDRVGTRVLVDCQLETDLGAKGRPDGPCQERRLSRDGCR